MAKGRKGKGKSGLQSPVANSKAGKKAEQCNAVGNANWKRVKASIQSGTQIGESAESKRTAKSFANYLRGKGSDCSPTRVIALDCEMVGVGPQGQRSALARVSIVNSYGNVVLDTFVQPKEPVTDFRTHVSGVRPNDLEVRAFISCIFDNERATDLDFFAFWRRPQEAPALEEVRGKVEELLEGRIVVGHALKNDFRALMVSHPALETRDTARFKRFTRRSPGAHHFGAERNTKSRKLRELAKQHLGVDVQEGVHSSVQDARAALFLYQHFQDEWERLLRLKSLERSFSRRAKRKPVQKKPT